MALVTETLLQKFAEDTCIDDTLSPEHALKLQIITDRNVIVASCALAIELEHPEAARYICETAFAGVGVVFVGGIDPDVWHQATRAIAANMSTTTTDPDHILASLSMGCNPYLDVAKFSHPSGSAKLR